MFKAISEALVKSSDALFRSSRDPELNGNLVLIGEKAFPRNHYPLMWTDIPEDLKISPYSDGRLLNGWAPAELCFDDMTESRVVRVAQLAGRKALKLTAILAAGVSLIAFPFIADTISMLPDFPTWALSSNAIGALAMWSLQAAAATIWTCGILAINYGWPLALLLPVFWWNGVVTGMQRLWDSVSRFKKLPTVDYHVYHESEAQDRHEFHDDYERFVLDVVTRLKGVPVFAVGVATGLMAARNVRGAPRRGTMMGIDLEQLRRHMIALGDTGTGKTRRFLMAMFRQVVINGFTKMGRKIGAYVTDGKGVLASQLLADCKTRMDDVRVIGLGKDDFGVDLLQGMTPEEVRDTMRKVVIQMSGSRAQGEAIWTEMPTLILYHTTRLARAMEVDENVTNDFLKDYGARPYSLYGIYKLVTNEKYLAKVMLAVGALYSDAQAQRTPDQQYAVKEGFDACAELFTTYINMPQETKMSFVANIHTVLGKTYDGNVGVKERFFCGTYDPKKTTTVDFALDGGILMIALGAGGAGGVSGHLAAIWMKTRLMVRALRRQQEDPEAAENNLCCMIADEFQLLATVGEAADDASADSGFWNIARSTGLFLICATQNYSTLRKAVGPDNAEVIMNNMSSRVVFKTQDKATLEYYQEKLGETKLAPSTFSGVYPNYDFIDRTKGEPSPWFGNKLSELLFPSAFNPSTTPAELYDINWYYQMNAQLPVEKQENPANIKKHFDELLRKAKEEAHKFRPKLRYEDLTRGQGYAFVMVERGDSTRYDLAALEPLVKYTGG